MTIEQPFHTVQDRNRLVHQSANAQALQNGNKPLDDVQHGTHTLLGW